MVIELRLMCMCIVVVGILDDRSSFDYKRPSIRGDCGVGDLRGGRCAKITVIIREYCIGFMVRVRNRVR